MTRRSRLAVVCTALALVLSCCATAVPPRSRLSAAEAALQGAAEAGAARDGRAVVYLRAAREEIAAARGFAAAGQYERAYTMALRAEADADLAAVLAREREVADEATLASATARRLAGNQL